MPSLAWEEIERGAPIETGGSGAAPAGGASPEGVSDAVRPGAVFSDARGSDVAPVDSLAPASFGCTRRTPPGSCAYCARSGAWRSCGSSFASPFPRRSSAMGDMFGIFGAVLGIAPFGITGCEWSWGRPIKWRPDGSISSDGAKNLSLIHI